MDVNRLTDDAALLSYYFILSLFPALLIIFSLLALLPDNFILQNENSWLMYYVPESLAGFLSNFLKSTGKGSSFAILSVSSVFALWTICNGMLAIIRQINGVYKLTETRNFLQLRILALFMSFSIGAFIFIPALLVLVEHYFLAYIPLPISNWADLILSLKSAKYIMLSLFIALFFAFIYKVAPCKKTTFKKIIPGSLISAALLLSLTGLLEYYLENYADYTKVYGGLAMVIILLLWLYLLGALLIFGAEVNKFYSKLKGDK